MRAATFAVGGMSCAGCARGVERALGADPGVRRVAVDFASGTVRLEWEPDETTLEPAFEEAARGGFEVRPLEDDGEREAEREAQAALTLRLALTAFFAMNAMLASLLLYLDAFADEGPEAARWTALFAGLMATPAVFVGGWPFFRKAALGLRTRVLGMDLLVSIGALAAWTTSVVLWLRGDSDVYFDTAAMIVLFLLVGRVIERSARARALDAVRSLLSLAPDLATRVVGEREEEVEVKTLAIGDRVRVRAGDRIAIDGRVVEGRASIDRAVLTGESEPRTVRPGDRVEAGAIDLDGALLIEVERPVGERAIDGVTRAVQELLSRRAPLQSLADRVASVLVLGVLALSALTVGLHLALGAGVVTALLHAIAVIVIACPCALGLATPMALVVAAGRAAREGIVFRDGEAIERAASVRAVSFDKTGTLTAGAPRVLRVLTDGDAAEVLRVAARAEAGARHPIGRAIVEAAGGATASGETTVVPGLGVRWIGSENGEEVLVGRAELLREAGVEVGASSARTVAHVARAGVWLGAIELLDPLRPGSEGAVRALRAEGMDLEILTGDAEAPARRVAAAVGIDAVHAGLRPEEKAARIASRPAPTAFVGDGVNDGPALAAAHLGVAATGATDVALATAQLALRSGGVERLPRALGLARRTVQVMRQNLGWALAYNAIALPAAVLGLVHPAAAALAMAASSISVVLSSLRLTRA